MRPDTLLFVRMLALIPALVAVLALVWALWAPARRYLWQMLVVAAVNIALTPLTSGVWFFHRAEKATYAQGLNNRDFTAYENLVSQHDPGLAGRMAWIAVLLLLGLAFMTLLQLRVNKGDIPSVPTGLIAIATVVLPALAALIQVYSILFRHA